ncbi:hypothetical protein [Micromonospora tulbaghiae]|uniref:hypothetical protein n=1 Tax=Micromonospora tulbaghiae TaxID=479978 RepID=UPI00342139A5
MTLPDRMWAALRLNRSALEARARFYSAYARLKPGPFDLRDVAELFRHGPVEGTGARVVNLLGPEPHTLGERLQSVRKPGGRAEWVRPAETADALRNAAIAELLLGTRSGRSTLLQASQGYRHLGLPFGDFLMVAAAGDRARSIAAARLLESVLSGATTADAEPLGRSATATPAQLRYLLFAAAPAITDPRPPAADEPLARRTTPVGSTAQPFSTWWRLGNQLTRWERRAEQNRRDVARTVGELAEAHGRQLELAMADEYHWSSGRARVDLIDLDLAGAVAISARTMRRRSIRPWSFEQDFSGLSPLAGISIEIGLDLGRDDQAPDDYFTFDPQDPLPGPRDDAARRGGQRYTDHD